VNPITLLTDDENQQNLARADRPAWEDRALLAGRHRSHITFLLLLLRLCTSRTARVLEDEWHTDLDPCHGHDPDDRNNTGRGATTTTGTRARSRCGHRLNVWEREVSAGSAVVGDGESRLRNCSFVAVAAAAAAAGDEVVGFGRNGQRNGRLEMVEMVVVVLVCNRRIYLCLPR
jgi:hypothetical protein